MSGALTWILVTQLEVDNAQQRLVRELGVIRNEAYVAECAIPASTLSCRPDTQTDYLARLSELASANPSERLLLLAPDGTVVFDSRGRAVGQKLAQPGSARPGGIVSSGMVDGVEYLGAVSGISPVAGQGPNAAARRNPLGAAFVFVARPRTDISAQAGRDLLPRLLLAAGVSLLLGVLLALVVSRAMTRPLSELAGAAEDIAAGNYGRRVGHVGADEIGVVGRSFNRMAEAVERARAAQRDFLANVSHELKTPLTSLIGFSQALMDGSLQTEGEKRRAAAILHEEAQRVLRMAQELLDLARVESGHISYHPSAVDVAALLDQEVEIVRQRAAARQLKLQLEVPHQIPPVKADAERLHQILENLFDNAVKYAPAGTEVVVRAAAQAGHVEVAVANPVGEHRPDPSRMFERFYRADPSRASGAGGVGLGLSISHQLASAMDGRLWADFDEAGRLRLRIVLPQADAPAPSGETSEPRPAA